MNFCNSTSYAFKIFSAFSPLTLDSESSFFDEFELSLVVATSKIIAVVYSVATTDVIESSNLIVVA